MKLKIAIYDNQNVLYEDLADKIKKIDKLKDSTMHIFSSFTDLIENIKKTKFDIIFIDVESDDTISGLNHALKAHFYNTSCHIIYFATYNYYFLDAMQADQFYFLQKPINEMDLLRAVTLALIKIDLTNNSYTYIYQSDGILHKINLQNVMYFESCHRIIKGYLADGSIIEFNGKMNYVEKEIQDIYPYFLRINKHYLVNYNHCDSIRRGTIIINNIEFKVSKKYKEVFESKFMKIRENRI